MDDAAQDAMLASGAVLGRGGKGVRSTRSLGVSFTPVQGCTGDGTAALAAAGVSRFLLRVETWAGVIVSRSLSKISRVFANSPLREIGFWSEARSPASSNGSDRIVVDSPMLSRVEDP